MNWQVLAKFRKYFHFCSFQIKHQGIREELNRRQNRSNPNINDKKSQLLYAFEKFHLRRQQKKDFLYSTCIFRN